MNIMILRTFFLFLAFFMAATSSNAKKQTYIVHMDESKMTAAKDSIGTSTSKEVYQNMMDSISNLSIDGEEEEDPTPPHLLYVYENAICGFAALLSTKQLESLKKMDGFLFSNSESSLDLHTTHSPEFLGLQLGKGLWSSSNTASDVVIGVLDTGIWPEHVSFQDSADMAPIPSKWKGICESGTNFSASNCNKKLIGARSFFKGHEAARGRVNETADYRSARDSNGHGTHTASTAAGNIAKNASFFGIAKGSAVGMSYTSRIAAYKVCWPSCQTSDILAAIDQAVADGVDILSLSLGSRARPYYEDSTAIASFGAMQKGVLVVCSAGNSGPRSYTVSNVAPWIMTIAASSVDRSFPAIVKLGNGKTFVGSTLSQTYATKQLPLVYGNTCTPGSLDDDLVKGKIVVCVRGGGGGRTRAGEVVKHAGGVGMLLLNTEAQGEEVTADPHILPEASLGALAGKAVINYVNSSSSDRNATASIRFRGSVYGSRAPLVAWFSSRGPSNIGGDVIKPDVTAPGVNILAAWPALTSPSRLPSDNRSVLYNIISGTSMSCPHVSGLGALIKSVHKSWSPAAIKSALMTSAYILDNNKKPIADVTLNHTERATPFAFGSGHVNPEAAADPGLVYDITPRDYLMYLCTLHYTPSQILMVSRTRFTCPKQLDDLNYPSFAVNFAGKTANISVAVTYKRTVTNVGNPTSNYLVNIEKPEGVAITVQPKMLKFNKKGQKMSYKVTVTGYKTQKLLGSPSFGSIVWVSGKYAVRSPIAITWV